jgi:hypothetical protein
MAKLNERYAPWQRVPSHRWMGGLLVAIGAGWTVAGASYAFGDARDEGSRSGYAPFT